MEKYLNSGIKDVIERFPEIGDILAEFEVGCVTCAVGTCLLNQVVEIHYLQPDQEAKLMYRIEKAIYPERELVKPASSQTGAAPGIKTSAYSPPIQELVDEHTLIKRLLALIPAIIDKMKQTGINRDLILGSLDFIRSYADRFHHAKEEDILFKSVDENQEIIQAMYEEHDIGRNHVQSIYQALENEDQATIAEHLLAYRELLTEHIKKEDELLYPWIDKQLADEKLTELRGAFKKANEQQGTGIQEKYENFVKKLENDFC